MTSCTSDDPSFVDTSVVVHLFDDAEPTKQQQGRALFAGDEDDPGELVLSTQVLGEFFVTARRKLGLDAEVVEAAVALLLAYVVQPVDRTLVQRAVKTVSRHQLSYWHALIVESAAAGGCDQIMTEDLTAGQAIRGVQIVNPFG